MEKRLGRPRTLREENKKKSHTVSLSEKQKNDILKKFDNLTMACLYHLGIRKNRKRMAKRTGGDK